MEPETETTTDSGLPWWFWAFFGVLWTICLGCWIWYFVKRYGLAHRAGNRNRMPPPMQPGSAMVGGQAMTPSMMAMQPQQNQEMSPSLQEQPQEVQQESVAQYSSMNYPRQG